MKSSVLSLATLGCLTTGAAGSVSALRSLSVPRNLLETSDFESIYFTESLTEADAPVLVLENGPFKLEAACETIEYSYPVYSYSYQYTSSTYRGPSSTYSYNYDDSGYYGPTSSSYFESVASLKMTYTAEGDDFVYGMPQYEYYPGEDAVIGGYTPGESRTATVFAGMDGGYGSSVTFKSTTGHFVSIEGGSTIGINKLYVENNYYYSSSGSYYQDMVEGFPEGVDCMLAGILSYVTPSTTGAE